MSSSLSIFDAATGTNKVVIANGPGATTSIAINPKDDSVYVGVGYGAGAGNIYSFSLNQIDSAYTREADRLSLRHALQSDGDRQPERGGNVLR